MTLGEPFAVPMSSLPQPLTGPVRWHQPRLAAAVLCAAAAIVTIVSTFAPLYSGELSSDSMSFSITVTAWSLDVTGIPEFGDAPTNGYPLVFAGIALICAAMAGAFAAAPAATPGGHRVAGLVTATATAFLTGTVWTVAVQATSWVDTFEASDGPPSTGLSADLGTGFWLLLVAVLAALAAVVLALLPPSQHRWLPAEPDLSTANLPTPPYGFAVAVELPQRHDEPSPYAPPVVDYYAQPTPADLVTTPPGAPPITPAEADQSPAPLAALADQLAVPAEADQPAVAEVPIGLELAQQPASDPVPAVPAVEDPLAPPLDERTIQPP